MLEIKGQVLHRVRLHVKAPGWLLNLNALLPKKLPSFLSRLNEISCGREYMCLVSGSLRNILKFLRRTYFHQWQGSSTLSYKRQHPTIPLFALTKG